MDKLIPEGLAQELLTMLKSTKEFVLEQAPDILKQFILYKRIELTLEALIGLVLLVVSIFGARYLMKNYNKLVNTAEGTPVIFGWMAAVVAAVVGLCVLLHTGFMALEAWVAPKIFLIEYLSHLVTGK